MPLLELRVEEHHFIAPRVLSAHHIDQAQRPVHYAANTYRIPRRHVLQRFAPCEAARLLVQPVNLVQDRPVEFEITIPRPARRS